MENRHYALARRSTSARSPTRSRTEYRVIVDRGLLLQIDAPDLAMERHTLVRRPAARRVPRVGRARDRRHQPRARRHRPRPACGCTSAGATTKARTRSTCRSRRSSRCLYRADVGALVISMANARHAHEHACFEREPLPDGMVLVAGVIDTTSNYVEHPEVVADRLVRVAEAVGDPRRVIAGTDCGFDTSAGIGDVAPSLVWEKLRAALRARAPTSARARALFCRRVCVSGSSAEPASPRERTRPDAGVPNVVTTERRRPSTATRDRRGPRSADRCEPWPTPR